MINIHPVAFALIYPYIYQSVWKALLQLFDWPWSAFIWHGDFNNALLRKWNCIPAPLCLICQAAIFVPILWQSKWHAVPGALWHLSAAPGDNNSSSAKRPGVLSGRSPPGASRSAPEASPPPPTLCSPRSGHKVLSYSHQTVWLEAAADVTVFVFGFVPSVRLFSLPLHLVSSGCQGAWRVSFLKAEKTWPVKEELRPWLLHLVNCVFFSFFAFTAKSTK